MSRRPPAALLGDDTTLPEDTDLDEARDLNRDTAHGTLASLRSLATAPMAQVVSWGAATSTGHVRPENEDAFGHLDAYVFAVADGMGGHSGGRLAAAVAVQQLLATVNTVGIADWVQAFARIATQVRAATRARGHERAGTTLTVVRLVRGSLQIAHVGDARVYRRRGDALDCLTTDHTVAAELATAGLDPAAVHGVGSHALTRYLGRADGNAVALPEVSQLIPLPDDQIVMVTDGVHRSLTTAEMVEALQSPSAALAATELVARADAHGGRDNATALVLNLGVATPGGHR